MTTDTNSPGQRETASNVDLPEPGKRRFPVGLVLIVLWVGVLLTIFLTLAYLKQNPPNRQGPVIPDSNQAVPANGDPSMEPRQPN
jgi:hypothetical protein